MKTILNKIVLSLVIGAMAVPVSLRAHCDTFDGPVVSAAREALEKGDATPVLRWVKAEDEAAIRAAFAKTSLVRKQSKDAAEVADLWFFETLVRIHRAGEGAPYTGLKAEASQEPGIAAADHAIASGKIDGLLTDTVAPLQAALKHKFERLMELKQHANDSVQAGRKYVEAYVEYVHFAERLASLAKGDHASHAEPASHAENGE